MMADAEKTDILVVDDLPEKHLAYEAVLQELGQNVIAVSSGAEALKQVLQRDFAVILLDVNMPDMDGFETARLIRSRKRSGSTPIIFLTAFTDEVRTAEGYATGAVDYLPTPVVPEILRAKVRVFVELFQMRQQVASQAEENARHAAAEEANRRLAFLADAGAILGRSLDFDATARDAISLPIPRVADVAALIFEPRGGIARTAITAQLTPDGSHRVRNFADTDPLPKELLDAMKLAMASSERISLLRPDADGTSDSIYCMAFPVQARGCTCAVLALSRNPSSPNFSNNDVIMATAFVSRAAIALENAVLHDELQAADHQKNSFLSMLAHELRNPLAPMRNAVQLLALKSPDEPDIQWIREVIDRQIVQMVRLVDDLLDISRITQGKIRLQCEPIELTTIVGHAVEASTPLIDARQHRLAVSLPSQSIWINGDLARLAQVLTNLLNNAAKYTDDEGQIWLTVRCDDGLATISVRDTGIGIPSHMIHAIFDLFTQVDRTLDRSQGGLGIGLTLVKRLTEMHGGTVSATSEGTGLGAEFTVKLPILKDIAPTPATIADLSPSKEWKTTILVVDDNVDSADTMARLLQISGHRVHVAYDGKTGLTAAQSFEPNIILLDIGLPGMDGYAVARQLREHPATKDVLLIAMTGYGQHKDELRARQAGFDHHLIKPVEFNVFESILAIARERGPSVR
ncbi:MAG: response regulator [Planctomycetota bacterium]